MKCFDVILSPLETQVLFILWKHKEMRVREIFVIIKKDQKVALTSIAVMLDRLHCKGIVERKVERARGGVRYVYFPLKTRKELERCVLEDSVNSMIERFGETAVSYFSERFKK
jgi:predicted transcriptional regulator